MVVVNILSAFLIAVLAGMGIGGGGLFVVYLTLILSMEQLASQGLNLMFFILSSFTSLFVHFRKRKINVKLVLLISVMGVLGSVAGSFLVHTGGGELAKKCFGIFLIAAGILSFIKSGKKQGEK